MNRLTLMPLTLSDARPTTDRFAGVIAGNGLARKSDNRMPVADRRQRRRNRQGRH